MTVAAKPATVTYLEDGASTSFPVPFRFKAATDLIVERLLKVGGVLTLALGTDYSVTGGATDAGGMITRTATPTGGRLRIRRSTARAQPMTYATGDRFPAASHEEALDRGILISQEQDADAEDLRGRALMLPPGEAAPDLPVLALRIGGPKKVLAINQVTGEVQLEPIDDAYRGAPGAADNTYSTYAALLASDPTRKSARLVPEPGEPEPSGTFAYIGNEWVRQAADGVNFDGRSIAAKLVEFASVTDARFAGGAKLDGVTDDHAACQAASAAARNILIPPGRLFLSRPWVLEDGRRIYGAGKSAWEPYTGGNKPAVYLTEIVVDATDAFDCRGTNSVTIEGVGICSKTGKQSVYRAAPGYQPKSGGIAITGSTQFQARDVSFFGLEYGVHSHLATASIPGGSTVAGVETDERSNSSNATQMPSISDWQASDCKRVFAFGSADSTGYTARDVRISNEVVALHCGAIIEPHWCDGLRVENVRFYQCTEHSIIARKTVFISLIGVTVFETGLDAIVLQECENITIDGLETGRAGFYQNPAGTPQAPIYAQRAALRLDRCITTQVSGIIEKPTGFSVDIDQCTTTVLNVACDTPFWLTGNATNLSGAIDVRQSDYTTINAAVGGANHQVAIWADPRSMRTLSGSFSGNTVGGVVRAVKLQQQGGYTHRVTASAEIVNNGVWQFDALRMLVPAGKKLMTRSVELTTTGVFLRANGLTWSAETLAEPGGGSIAFDDKVLAENNGSTDIYVSVSLALVNLSGAPLTIPPGHESRLSTVIV